MSVFDLQNATFTEASDTKFTPVPEKEYIASIRSADDVKLREAKDSTILDVTWTIDDAEATTATGIENPKVRQSVFLDISSSGGLDFSKGKNIQLGRLREALGQNTSGQPWSFGMLVGGVARINVKHRIVGEDIYTDVKGVAKA